MDINLNLSYSQAQEDIFHNNPSFKYIIVRKGRRGGFTQGAAHSTVEYLLAGLSVLWGDTIHSNIDRYVDRYFMPILKQLPEFLWSWNIQKKELKINGVSCDFRSADKPENWEGFAYHKIILNEAGIILNNDYLYDNAILPMLMDFPDSQLIAGGVPKGKTNKKGNSHKFYKLWQKADAAEEGYLGLTYTAYDNPFMPKSEVDKLLNELDPFTAQQEIYAEFISRGENPFLYSFEERHISPKAQYNKGQSIYVSIDFNINPMVGILAHKGRKDGKPYIHYFDEIVLEDANVWKWCDVFNSKYSGNYILATGDRTSKKREITQKSNAINAWTIIQKQLNLSDGQIRLPNNPDTERAAILMNSIFSKHPEILIHPRCKKLINDCWNVEMDKYNKIMKANRSDPNQQADALDCLKYDLHTWHNDFIKYL